MAAERPETSREHAAALVAAERMRLLYGDLLESAKADNDATVLQAVPPLEALDSGAS